MAKSVHYDGGGVTGAMTTTTCTSHRLAKTYGKRCNASTDDANGLQCDVDARPQCLVD